MSTASSIISLLVIVLLIMLIIFFALAFQHWISINDVVPNNITVFIPLNGS
jgi:hypothetical protein